MSDQMPGDNSEAYLWTGREREAINQDQERKMGNVGRKDEVIEAHTVANKIKQSRAIEGIAHMQRRPAREQRLHSREAPGLARIMQRVLVVVPAGSQVRARVQQRVDGHGVAAQRGDVQRGPAVGVGLVHEREPLGGAEELVQVDVAQAHDDLVQGGVVGLVDDGGEGKMLDEEVGRGGVLLDPEEEGGRCVALEGAVEASGVISKYRC